MDTHKDRFRPWWRHASIVMAIGLATTLVGLSPANATMYEEFRYDEADEDVFSDCGIDEILVEFEYSGRGHIRTGKGKDAGAFFLRENYSSFETWTNPENDKFFTISSHGVYQDIKATRVEGSIFEFVTHDVGQPFVLRDMDGNVVLRNRGAITETYVFDTGGDDEPGGEWLSDLDVRVSGPHPGFFLDEEDRCDLVRELIG